MSDNKVATVNCPDSDPGPGSIGDLHRQLHGHPGRRGRRVGDQHGHGQRDQSAELWPSASTPSSVTVPASDATSSLSLVKSTSRPTRHGYGTAGDTIAYSYLVTNTGTTTVTGIGVSDNLIA